MPEEGGLTAVDMHEWGGASRIPYYARLWGAKATSGPRKEGQELPAIGALWGSLQLLEEARQARPEGFRYPVGGSYRNVPLTTLDGADVSLVQPNPERELLLRVPPLRAQAPHQFAEPPRQRLFGHRAERREKTAKSL